MEKHINIANQVVRGSKNLNRMREEVDQVIRTFAGLIKKRGIQCHGLRFVTGDCAWQFQESKDQGVVIACYASAGNRRELVYTSDCKDPPAMQNTQQIYSELNTFASRLLQSVPSLEEEIDPLIQAATFFV